MAGLGFRHFDELIGRADLLCQRTDERYKGVELSRLLCREEGPADIPGGRETRCVQDQIHKIHDVLDIKLIEDCKEALENRNPVVVRSQVKNTDRAVGAMLSFNVSRRYGGQGLPENFITVDFNGSAGQSFGAFLARGITFRLAGDTNDYLGKGLSGGRIVVTPPPGSLFKSN